MNEIYNFVSYEPMSRSKCFNIINARLLGSEDLHVIRINDRGIIETIIAIDNPIQKTNNEKVLNVNGDWITLGGVDLQINGGLGLAFPELEKDHFSLLTALCDFYGNTESMRFCRPLLPHQLKIYSDRYQ